MKYLPHIAVLLCLAFAGCAPMEEVRPHAERPPEPAPEARPSPPPEPIHQEPLTKEVFSCEETTGAVFNRCGIEVRPFMRPVFSDIDGDGRAEMIVGTRDEGLILYKDEGTGDHPHWSRVEGYFRGIDAGAYLSPSLGDIDGDGRDELAVGTGGFSRESGRVVFYRNAGSVSSPQWQRIEMPEITVGNDATPVMFRNGGSMDMIVGNADGRLFYFRNRIRAGRRAFELDRDFFRGIRLGMYVVPAVISDDKRTVIIVGNDLGKLQILERDGRNPWRKSVLRIEVAAFAAPCAVDNAVSGGKDLVVADGSGRLRYFRGVNGGYRHWAEDLSFFDGRILSGQACSPALSEINGRPVMVVGNIHGELRLYEFDGRAGGMPWSERNDYFRGVKLAGFSRGVLIYWKGDVLLIAGQQDGGLRAFRNSGSEERPSWAEVKGFFRGLPVMTHAAPAVFDIDGDGEWELVVGDEQGLVRGFRQRPGGGGMPLWEELDLFSGVKGGRFATPALYRDGGRVFLLLGGQEGRIAVFSGHEEGGRTVFAREDPLAIKVRNHSVPSAIFTNGRLDLTVGDYDGNLRQYACIRKIVTVSRD